MKKKHKKILHGMSELAGQGWYSVLGLRKLGLNAQMVEWQANPFGYPYDHLLNIDPNKKYLLPWYAVKIGTFFIYSLFRYNVFHFHYGRSICLNHDLGILKLLGKRVVFEYHGSDIRDPQITYKLTHQLAFENDVLDDKIKRINNKICRSVRTILFHDDELIAHLPKYHGDIFVVPLRIDTEKFCPVYPEERVDTVKIVHAPSNRSIKGTEFVLNAVAALKEKYTIELILVENMPQDEAKKIYADADIIIDQLVIGTYGVFAIEGMALGKPVITYITDEMKSCFPEELPIISANSETLMETLEDLIADGVKRRKAGIAGRKYIENYHDYTVIAELLNEIYDETIPPLQGREAFARVKAIKDRKTQTC